jgi:hypothetical protein
MKETHDALSPTDLAFFGSVGNKLPASHRYTSRNYDEKLLPSGLHVEITDPTTQQVKPGLRLYRGMKKEQLLPQGIVSLGASAEPRLLIPNPVQRFVEAVHEDDDTTRDGMIGSHVRGYKHAQSKLTGAAPFASPFLSSSPDRSVLLRNLYIQREGLSWKCTCP